MSSDKNNIYIDSSFFSEIFSDKDIAVSFNQNITEYIGNTHFRVDFKNLEVVSDYVNKEVDLNLPEASYIESENLSLDYRAVDVSTLAKADSIINFSSFSSGTLIDNRINNYIDYAVYLANTSGVAINNQASFTGGKRFDWSKDFSTVYRNLLDKYLNRDVDVDYVNFTGDFGVSGTPVDTYSSSYDKDITYGFSDYVEAYVNSNVEIKFIDWIISYCYADCFSAYLSYSDTIITDVEINGSGTKTGISSCVFSVNQNTPNIMADLYCSLVDYFELAAECTTISGSKDGIIADLYSVYMTNSGIVADVSIFPIYFDNFSLDVSSYISSSGTICIDAHDSVYGLVSSGTYFSINDTIVSGSKYVLTDGIRLCFNVGDYSEYFGGTNKLTAKAENLNGDILEEDFYLTSGYIVDFNNKKRIGMDYGFDKKVYVRMEAENLESCPQTTTDGYWFVSEHMASSDISADIFAWGGYKSDTSNLTASLTSHNNYFYYGKEFEVVITASDFAGNEMEPYSFNFKISV